VRNRNDSLGEPKVQKYLNNSHLNAKGASKYLNNLKYKITSKYLRFLVFDT